MNLHVAAAVARKGLKIFFSDRRAVLVSFVTPIAIASFFGYLFSGGGGSETARIPVLVADLDGSSVSQALVEGLRSDEALEVSAAAETEAREEVRKGKATVVVVIPEGFASASTRAFFRQTKKPVLKFLYDPSHPAELGMVRGILTEYVMKAVSMEAFTGEAGRDAARETLEDVRANSDLDPEDRRTLEHLLDAVVRWQDRDLESEETGKKQETAAPGLTMPFATEEKAVTAREGVAYNGYAHSFGGMAIQFVLFAAIEFGMGILEERDRGLWKRLRSAPVSRTTVLLGETVGGAVISLLILVVTLAFGMVVFGFRIRGSALGLAGICVLTALMASAFGLFLAAVGRTAGATRGIAIFAVLVLVMLGGAWVPAFVFPAWLQKVTLVIPVRWAVDGFDAMTWRGIGIEGALAPMAVLLVFTILFAALTVWRFRWQEA